MDTKQPNDGRGNRFCLPSGLFASTWARPIIRAARAKPIIASATLSRAVPGPLHHHLFNLPSPGSCRHTTGPARCCRPGLECRQERSFLVKILQKLFDIVGCDSFLVKTVTPSEPIKHGVEQLWTKKMKVLT
jgi:hypothetical protein